MPSAIMVEATGGPEKLVWREIEVGDPGPGEARVRHTAIGLNFLDIYYRKGVYPPPGGLPLIPGGEGAGVVEAVGEGVSDLAPGDRVVYQTAVGAYAEVRLIAAEKLVKLPDDIDDRTAAAVFLKGVTAEVLLHRTFRVGKGTTLLWHAAAGGVGSIATRWAAALGATVIGTVGSEEKAAVARANGCAHVINYAREDFVARVRELTNGAGVDVVYDSVGKDTFPGSLDSLRPLGLWVAFGQSSGLPPPFQISLLQQKGSLFATRASVVHYLARRADLLTAADALFAALRAGTVRAAVNHEWPLIEAADAQRAVEERRTTGATVLVP